MISLQLAGWSAAMMKGLHASSCARIGSATTPLRACAHLDIVRSQHMRSHLAKVAG